MTPAWYCGCGTKDCRACNPNDWWEDAAADELGDVQRKAAKALGITEADVKVASRVLDALIDARTQHIVDGIDAELLAALLDGVEEFATHLSDVRAERPTQIEDFDPRKAD